MFYGIYSNEEVAISSTLQSLLSLYHNNVNPTDFYQATNEIVFVRASGSYTSALLHHFLDLDS